MKKTAMLLLPIALFAAGLLLGAYALGSQPSAQASVPVQIADADGWSVQQFTSMNFEPGKWENIGQVGSCVVYSSRPGVDETAFVDVRTPIEDFRLVYPNVGARLTTCAGFTAFFPPEKSGRPASEDR